MLLGASAVAQEAININSSGEASLLRAAQSIAMPEGALRTRSFDYNPRLRQLTEANKGDTLLLDFFDDSRYKAVVANVATDVAGVLGITAHIVDSDFAACFISVSDAGISLRADLPACDAQYRAAKIEGATSLSHFSLSDVRRKSAGPDIALPPPTRSQTIQPATAAPQTKAADDIEEPVTIDVLIVYTAKSKQWAEQNVTSIDNAINQAFQYGNYVLSNSQTKLTLNMVYKYETNYAVENLADASDALGPLQNPTDGVMDDVHALRRKYGADLVALMPVGGGVGFLPSSNLTEPSGGFSVTGVEGSVYSTTLVHEIGHNLGTHHHWQQKDGPGPGIFPYSSAWRGKAPNGKWYFTIQSYGGDQFPDKNPSTMIPYFSNPDITVHGVRIGSYEKENNALTIKQTKHMIARYSELIGAADPFEVGSAGVLTGYYGQGGHVGIPANIGVTAIGSSVFRGLASLQAIIIPEGVTAIGERAFENCAALGIATLPASLTDIGASTFGACTALGRIYANAATPPAVAANAFAGVNTAACNLVVPVGKKSLYTAAAVWKDFGTITEVHTSGDFVVDDGVLKKYAGLAINVVIPSDVYAIADIAFYGSRITSVVMGETLQSIGRQAFAECRNLESVSIPASVTYIGDDAFDRAGVSAINVAAGNAVYSSVDGVLFTKDKSQLLQYPMEKTAAAYNIPDGVEKIRERAFHNNNSLESVSIPASVKYIGDDAFDLAGVSAINVAAGNTAYSSADGVLFTKDKSWLMHYPMRKTAAAYNIPDGVESIRTRAFRDNNFLQSVTVPASVRSIEYIAFESCQSLRSIEVSEANAVYASVDGMLLNKSKTELIRYPGGKPGKVVIPASVTDIGWICFWNCTKPDSMLIPASVQKIEPDFGNFHNLRHMAVYWSQPLAVPDDLFKSVNLSNTTLSVPPGRKALYQSATVWKKFGRIVERSTDTGLEEAIALPSLTVRSSAEGLRLSGLRVGDDIKVYSIAGQLIYICKATATEQVVPLSERGIVIVASGGRSAKAVL
jgi:hypothetical protein